MLVLKLDRHGEIEWQQTFGGDNVERGYFIQQTSDRGFVLTGRTESFSRSGRDTLVMKLKQSGKIEWANVFIVSGSSAVGDTILETNDGGFLVSGTIRTFGAHNILLMKLRKNGHIEWAKTFGGGFGDNQEQKMSRTSDGGFILVGFLGEPGRHDILVVKLSPNLSPTTEIIEWAKTFGGPGEDTGRSITQTSDGGFLFGATTTSFLTGLPGDDLADGLIFSLHADGTRKWMRACGGTKADAAGKMQEVNHGRTVIMAGRTTSQSHGSYDGLILKLHAANGNSLRQEVFRGDDRDWLEDIEPMKEGGFIVSGATNSFGLNWNILVMKLDANGGIKDCPYLERVDNRPNPMEVRDVTNDVHEEDITSALRSTVQRIDVMPPLDVTTEVVKHRKTLPPPRRLCGNPLCGER